MGARLFVAGLLVAGAAVGGGVEAYRINEDPTVILTPVDKDHLPKEKPIIDSLATLVCDASVVLDNCNEQTMLGSKSVGKHETVYLSNVSPFVPQALRAGEDRKFDEHFGADGHAIIRAGWHNIVASVSHLQVEMKEGASTITSQDARWRYGLPHATNLIEKRHEAEIAMGLEKALEPQCEKVLSLPVGLPVEQYTPADYTEVRKCVKEQVMTDFLNRAYFGRGAFGIEMAARQTFGVTAAELTQPQAIYEVASLQAPSDSDLVSDTAQGIAEEKEIVHERYDEIVNDLAEVKDADSAKKKELLDAFEPMIGQIIPFVPLGGVNTTPAKAIAAEHVTVRAMSDAAGILGISEDELAAGGYKIGITIDPHAQAIAGDLVRVTDNNADGYQAAMVGMAKDGAVISMVGGLDRSVSKVNLATGVQGGGSGRNAGSSFKMAIVAMAYENGRTPEDVIHIDTAPDKNGVLHGAYTMVNADNGKHYTIDSGDSCKKFYGAPAPCDETILQGTEGSDNVLFAHLLGEQGTAPQYGAKRVYEILRDLGSDIQGDPVASVVVGSGDVSVYSQAQVANGLYLHQGQNQEPYLVSKIMDSSGKIVYDHSTLVLPPGKQAVSPSIAVETTQTMRAPIEGTHGTAHAIDTDYGIPPNTVAGKTGTSPRTVDAWFNGATCDNETGGISFSFWIGNPKNNTTTLPKGVTSGTAARLAGAYIAGIGAATDGCQLPTQPS